MLFVPKGTVREIGAKADAHAVVIVTPGGREGTARAGALPTPEARPTKQVATIFRAAFAKAYGPATIYVEPATMKATPLAASLLAMPAGATVAEHVHAAETEMLYVLEGSGTMTIAGTSISVTPTSVVQIPPNTKHSFVASADVRAVQIYTPPGPEQRFKKKP
jgi:quercetin dioxygenase-like cupin family protein